MTTEQLNDLVGCEFQNKRTGSVATVLDILPDDIIWLSDGAIIPAEEFTRKWQAVK